MNFLDARLADGGAVLETAGGRIPVPRRLAAALAGQSGRNLVTGIRPENVVPEGRTPRGEAVPLNVAVEIAEPLGDEVVVHGRAGDGTLVFKQDPHRATEIGSRAEVRLELDALHVFDAETQLRIGA
jgi:multiple sugar transport system ATP-binding protein